MYAPPFSRRGGRAIKKTAPLLAFKSPVAAQLPGFMAIGATSDVSVAIKVTSATAEMLRYFGINMSHSLIADVNFNEKLFVIATCHPYDFLKKVDEIKNHITIYEHTLPAFDYAVDMLFRVTQPKDLLTVLSLQKSMTSATSTKIGDITSMWHVWSSSLPK